MIKYLKSILLVIIFLFTLTSCSLTESKVEPSYQNSIVKFAERINYARIIDIKTMVKPIPNCIIDDLTCKLPGATQNFQPYYTWEQACTGLQNLGLFLNLNNYRIINSTYFIDPRKLVKNMGEPLNSKSQQTKNICLNQPAPFLYLSGDISNTGNLPIYVVVQLHHLPSGELQLQTGYYNKNKITTSK